MNEYTTSSLAKERGQSDFKASAGWCTRYMRRNNLVLRQKTHIAQKLPKDVDCKVDSFLKYVIDLRKEYDFSLGDIGNMDETFRHGRKQNSRRQGQEYSQR